MSPNYFWQFKPLVGLKITDEYPEKEEFIFKDTTLFSKEHIHQMIPELAKYSIDPTQLGVGHEILKILEMDTCDAFIGVKRKCNNIQPDKMEEQFLSADNRIYQMSTLLELALLYKSNKWCTCALVEQIFKSEKINTFFKYNHPGMGISGSRRQLSQINRPPIKMAISELKQLFQDPKLKNLYTYFSIQNGSSITSLHQALLNSAMYLARAIHSPDLSNKILFSVTAIELLFKLESKNSYDLMKKRIKVFIGDEAYQFYHCDDVFDARHKFVHAGADAECVMLPFLATGLSLVCIIQLSYVLDRYKGKEEFIYSLDANDQLSKLAMYDTNYGTYPWKHEILNIKFDIFKDSSNFEIPNIFMKLTSI